jgi:hypothetical protein
MSYPGRGALASGAQRAEVLRLHAEKRPIRQIAEAVFGAERFRGRVERIIKGERRRSTGAGLAAGAAARAAELEGLSVPGLVRLFMRRLSDEYIATGRVPSLGQLTTMMDLERQLQTLTQLEAIAATTQRRRQQPSRVSKPAQPAGADQPDDD